MVNKLIITVKLVSAKKELELNNLIRHSKLQKEYKLLFLKQK